MYIDIDEVDDLNKNNKTRYNIAIYRNRYVEKITTDNVKIVAKHIRNLMESHNEKIYMDDMGCGALLANYLTEINTEYIPLIISSISL